MFDSISVVCWGQSSDLSVPHFPPLELFLFSQSQKIVCLLGSAFSVCRLVPLSELLQKLGLEMVPETESTWPFQLLWALLVGEWDLLVIDWAGTWLHPRTRVLADVFLLAIPTVWFESSWTSVYPLIKSPCRNGWPLLPGCSCVLGKFILLSFCLVRHSLFDEPVHDCKHSACLELEFSKLLWRSAGGRHFRERDLSVWGRTSYRVEYLLQPESLHRAPFMSLFLRL